MHVKNLKSLSLPLEELEAEVPKLSDLDTSVRQCLINMRNMISKVSIYVSVDALKYCLLLQAY